MNDVVDFQQPVQTIEETDLDIEIRKQRAALNADASLHARHVLALQAANKALHRKNSRIASLTAQRDELRAALVHAERQMRHMQRVIDSLDHDSVTTVQDLLAKLKIAR